MSKMVVIQKGNKRYSFYTKEVSTVSGIKDDNPFKKTMYTLQSETCLTLGGTLSWEYFKSAEEGNKFYLDCIAKGFKRFRNLKEVSWYATVENNTPYDEEWKTEGIYLVPVKSRVFEEED